MKQSELDEILKEKEKIETMLSSFGAPFVVADIGGKIIEANELYQNIFGSVEKAHEVKKPLLKAIKKSFEQDQPVSEELQFGEPINRAFIVQINLVKDALGVANQAAAVMHDVTSRIKFEELQEEFLKGISQALKSPIASISAGAETLLARSDMSQESAPLLLKIKAQSERMAKLLNDILYLSSLDNSHPQFNKVKLNDIVQGAIKDVHAGNGRKKIKLENLVSPEIEVWADSAKIAQAIYNLLDNAHKFTEDGGVIQVDAAKHNGVVEIAVIDNGAGIKKEDLPHLFERFYQPQSNGSVKGTTGLGLAIVKHIIEMHQGKIWAESEPGWWSKFYFTLKSVDSPQPR
jgi:two-component system phosphate regulon sensor histidine kinase PhoR